MYRPSHLGAAQGECETRRESYVGYGDRALEHSTQSGTKNISGAAGFASRQRDVLRWSRGYTIIESMIFLVVTGALVVSALTILSGTQSRTRFSQSLRELDAQIHTTLNEVESGYFPNDQTFTCSVSGGLPKLQAGTNSQGTNAPCIFIGKVIQFGSPTSDRFSIVTVVGKRLNGTTPVASLSQAGPTAAVASPAHSLNSPNLSIDTVMPGVLRVQRVYAIRDSKIQDIGAIGFISTFTANSNGDPLSGSHNVTLVTVPGSSIGDNLDSIFTSVRAITESDRNPDQVVICLANPGTGSSSDGALSIGGQGQELTTEVFVGSNIANVPGGGC